MKKVLFSALAASFVVFSAFTFSGNTSSEPATAASGVVVVTPVSATAKAYAVNTAKSKLAWDAKKVTGEHNGTVKISKGEILVDKNKPVSGSFTIDMRSIECLDITDAGYNQKLVGHLKSDDFFSVDKHPTASFKTLGIAPISNAKAGGPTHTVRGELTIKGITNPISFPATITTSGKQVTAKADIVVDRSKYDVRYGSNSFFEGLGDKAIYDEFTMKLDLVANAG